LIGEQGEETVYVVDVRLRDDFRAGHIPGSSWMPGGQAVQTADATAVVHNAPVVFICDGVTRAAITGSWYRQMGKSKVYALDGGTVAWTHAGFDLVGDAEESGSDVETVLGLDAALSRNREISVGNLASDLSRTVLFVGTSTEFAEGHVPDASWVSRGVLEDEVGPTIPGLSAPVAVTCEDGGDGAALAAATLSEMGYQDVVWLKGGMESWRSEGRSSEKGLSGVMSAPLDVLPAGTNRSYGDMINYLRWETALVEQPER
jgi:rhodanese-related sulfurtransferase